MPGIQGSLWILLIADWMDVNAVSRGSRRESVVTFFAFPKPFNNCILLSTLFETNPGDGSEEKRMLPLLRDLARIILDLQGLAISMYSLEEAAQCPTLFGQIIAIFQGLDETYSLILSWTVYPRRSPSCLHHICIIRCRTWYAISQHIPLK